LLQRVSSEIDRNIIQDDGQVELPDAWGRENTWPKCS